MKYYILSSRSNELYHHGIKGMKWGVRRFQNPDGSLTKAGIKRYATKGFTQDAYNSRKTKLGKAYDRITDGHKTRGNVKYMASSEADRVARAEKYLADDINDYRQKQINKAIKSGNSKDLAFYTNISDDVIRQEMARRENVKKAVIAGAVVVGVATAGYVAYRMSVKNQLADIDVSDITPPKIKDVLKKAQADLDNGLLDKDTVSKLSKILPNDPDAVYLAKGSEVHRQVGFKNFDLSKMKDKNMYASINETDTAAYMTFLRDWNNTGKRYDVKLKTISDIIAPSDKRAREIFDEVWNNNSEYRNKLEKTLVDAYTKAGVKSSNAKLIVRGILSDPDERFKSGGMYSFVKGQEDSGILRDAYKKAGYTAIIDYFDKGSVARTPMIFFNADSQMVKEGETFVTKAMKVESAKKVFVDKTHPLHAMARDWLKYEGFA